MSVPEPCLSCKLIHYGQLEFSSSSHHSSPPIPHSLPKHTYTQAFGRGKDTLLFLFPSPFQKHLIQKLTRGAGMTKSETQPSRGLPTHHLSMMWYLGEVEGGYWQNKTFRDVLAVLYSREHNPWSEGVEGI